MKLARQYFLEICSLIGFGSLLAESLTMVLLWALSRWVGT